jgi:hypothetical protein
MPHGISLHGGMPPQIFLMPPTCEGGGLKYTPDPSENTSTTNAYNSTTTIYF